MTSEQKLAEIIPCDIEIRQVSIEKYVINYAVAGFGAPLLLIHGGNIGWGSWYKNIPELAKYFTVYAIDLPGSGRSAPVDFLSLDVHKDFLDIVGGFISQMNFTTFSVMGASVGGWVALQLALLYPGRVDKLVLSDPAGFSEYISMNDKVIGWYPLAKLLSLTVLYSSRRNAEKFLRTIFYNKESDIAPTFIDYFQETMTLSPSILFISRMNALHHQFAMGDHLGQIKNNTLIIWGEQDNILPLARNRKSFSLVPNARAVIIKNTGHMPFLEKSEEYNQSVIEFLTGKHATP